MASSGHRPEMLLYTLRRPGQPPAPTHTKKLFPNANGTWLRAAALAPPSPLLPLLTHLAGPHQSLEIPNQRTSAAQVHINYISLASDGDTDQMLLLSPLTPHETRMSGSKFIIQLLRETEHAHISPGPGYLRASPAA